MDPSGGVALNGPPLCVVGNVNRDVKLLQVAAGPGLFEDGETSVAGVLETIGGGGANSACAAAALGGEVRFVGKVGTDALGDRLQQALEARGVETHLARDARSATGTSVALGYVTGHRHFLSCLPNNETLAFADINLNVLDGCGHLLRADVWFSRSMLAGGNRRLFAEARRRGLAVSLDINFDPRWSTGAPAEIAARKEQLRSTLDLVDLAHGNTRELCELTGQPELASALNRLTAWGVQGVVVHLGKEGAGYWTGTELVVEPPEFAANPVHSTGTGDVLSVCMTLLHGRREMPLRDKLRLANHVVREFMEGKRDLIPKL